MACLGLVSCRFLLLHPSSPENPELHSFLDTLYVSEFCHGCRLGSSTGVVPGDNMCPVAPVAQPGSEFG